MKKTLLALAAVLTLGITAASTDAFARGHGGGHGHGHGGGFHGHHGGFHGGGWHRRNVGFGYRPYLYAGSSSCYRTEWIGGPRWRRLRRVFICG